MVPPNFRLGISVRVVRISVRVGADQTPSTGRLSLSGGQYARLVATGIEKYTTVLQGIPGSVVAVGIAVLLFSALWFLPKPGAR
jgi:hypothetical protein